MTLKTCSNKLNPFLNMMGFTFKKNLGFTAVATVIALLFSPGLIWNMAREMLEYDPKTIYDLMGEFDYFAICIAIGAMAFCAILLIINFSYLYNKKGTDAFHALPLTRTELFAARFVPAFVCSLVPLSAAYIGYMGISALPGIYADCSYILPAYLFTVFMMLLLSLFIMVFVLAAGAVFDAVISIAAVNIGVPIIIVFVEELCNDVLYGYSNSIVYEMFIYGTPFGFATYKLMEYGEAYNREKISLFPLWQTVILVLIIAALVALCLYLYNKRKSEKSGEAYAFPFMPVLISVILGFIGYYVLGFIFSPDEFGTVMFYIMGAVGAALVVVIYSMITNRGFKKLKHALIISGATVVLVMIVNIGISLDVFGYESYMPNRKDIASASVNVVQYTTVKEENIDDVLALHSEIIKNKKYAERGESIDYVNITYTLKTGVQVNRSYLVSADIGAKEKLSIVKNVTAPQMLREFEKSTAKEYVIEGYYGENDKYYGSVRITPEKAKELMLAYTDYLENIDETYFHGYEDSVYIYSGDHIDDYWLDIHYNNDANKLIGIIKEIFEQSEQVEE